MLSKFPTIMLAGLLARLPYLASRPLWYDEAFAVLFSSKGPRAMAYGTLATQSGVAADVHPLGYYSLLWLWGRQFGTSPLVVRSLSVAIGLAVVALGYLLAKRVFGPRTAVLAGWLLVLSPFQVHYAQEVRMYALMALLLLGTCLLAWEGLRRGQLRYWIGYGLLAAAAQYTHNLAALTLVPLAATPLLLRKRRALLWTAFGSGLALLLYLPWLLRLPSQVARIRWAYWITRPGPIEWVRTLLTFVSGLPVWDWALPIALFLAVLVLLLACWGSLLKWRLRERGHEATLWLGWMAISPAALMAVLSLWQPIYLERALLPAGAFFLIWVAAICQNQSMALRNRITLLAALLFAFAIGLPSFYGYRGFPYAPFVQLTEALSASKSPNEIILHSNKLTALPAAYYAPDLEQRYLADPPGSGSDTLALATQQVLGMLADDEATSAIAGADGVWFVIFAKEIEEYAIQGASDPPGLAALSASLRLESLRSFDGLQLYHYVK